MAEDLENRRRRTGRESSGAAPAGDAIRAIPSDHEAERAVLGAILLDHDCLYKIEDKLTKESFDLPAHRVLYEACLALHEKQQSITLITLRSHLAEQGLLEKLGGVSFLSEIAGVVTTAAHVESHAELVREKALQRSLIRTLERLAARGYEGGSAEELLEQAEREVLKVAMGHASGDFQDLESELPDTMKFIQRVQAGEITGAPTGFIDLDDKTGGFDPGDLIILAARPSMGKTAFALNIARNHSLDGNGCTAIYSLEMTTRQLVLRLLMAEARRDLGRFRKGLFGERDMANLARASTELERARIFIDDSAAVTMSDISAKARRLHREQKLTLLIVDYIQLINSRKGSRDNREQEVAEISRSLKLLAKDLNLPVLALSQLNRGPEGRPNKRPQLADLRESGAIEQDADIVMFIYRDEVYHEDSPDAGLAEIIIAKQRNGPTGTVKLQFEGRFARFGNLAGDYQSPPPEAGFADDDDFDAPSAAPSGLDPEPPF